MRLRQPLIVPSGRPLRVLIHARFSTEEQRQSSIRRTIYRGFETNSKKVAKRKLRSGKSECVWNDEDKIQNRESPHLRIVSDALWYRANEVVDGRRVFKKPIRGAGHPLRGTTRQRRGLLAGVFTCGVCGSPMYSHGKTDGVFRCSGASKGTCWYRGYCMRERVYPAVLEAIVAAVLSIHGVRDAVLARVRDLAIVWSRRRKVEEQAGRKEKLPSTTKLLDHLEAVKAQLLGDEARAAVILRQLLNEPIRVIPYMRIDGKRVVPRLEFTLNLVGALPPAVARPLLLAKQGGEAADAGPPAILERTLLVNAFAEPDLVRHARLIVARRLEGKMYKEIAKECDLTKYHMENFARITQLMEEAGLPEPYRRLTDKPDHVPQWCSKHWLKAGERKGGGKRRRAS